MTTEEALKTTYLAAAKRALAQAEADLKAAGAGLAAMRTGAILRSLR